MQLDVQLELRADDQPFEHSLQVIRLEGQECIGAPYRFELQRCAPTHAKGSVSAPWREARRPPST